MLHTIATGLAVLGAVGICYVGVSYLLAPQKTAAGFGLPAWPTGEAAAFLPVKGVRDLVFGLAVVALLVAGLPQAVGWLFLVGAITPLGDMLIVLRHKGSKALAYGMHGSTAVVVAVTGALLLLG
ncbi:DUF4267 domain-containing protein [Solihabitans fulvus]|uniref:DUF4267 domain-containing protein n=1 Tax=Solihabitans fulvus TaxID=1892852 RepID=A0A5B2WKG5_9PSEU|nr:DUF4267 domain-containing protein [Solihabitans fulvus]KAA2251404.1 DUF4267 domain-containing protein [Solihabitans fulvus]